MHCYCGKCRCENEVQMKNVACNHCNNTCYNKITDYKHKVKRRFNESDILNIRIQYNQGVEQKQIAKIYNCHQSSISEICTGKTYNWVK